ncbi:MAG: sulfurtransferase TusA family protein, partial [Kordiimonas sp.]
MSKSLTSKEMPPHSEFNGDVDLNLLGTVCPMGFVKTRIFLDTKKTGDIISILYEDTAANEPLTRS